MAAPNPAAEQEEAETEAAEACLIKTLLRWEAKEKAQQREMEMELERVAELEK